MDGLAEPDPATRIKAVREFVLSARNESHTLMFTASLSRKCGRPYRRALPAEVSAAKHLA